MVAKTKKEGCKLGGVIQTLTQKEQEILFMLTDEFLTPRKIAIRRKTSHQSIYKTIKNLKKKGAFDIGFNRVAKNLSTLQPSDTTSKLKNQHQIRLHAQEFNINILYKDERYNNTRKRANVLIIDGNIIRLYKDTLEIYSGQDFYAYGTQKATSLSFQYWNRFFIRLEHELDIILIKPRSQNIKLVNAHYSEINNELAKECNINAEKIRIYTTDDGKLWFLMDKSLNLNEAEALHPQTSKQDMGDIVNPFFNDLRDNKPPLPSEIWRLIGQTNKLIIQEIEPLREFHKDIKIHNEVLKNINQSFKKFNNLLSQKRLSDCTHK